MPTLPTSATIQFTFTQHQKLVRSISWSPNGLLASGSDDANVLIWNSDGTVQQQLQHQAPVRSLAWSPDNQFIATGSANQVSFWRATTGTFQTQTNSPHTNLVTSIAWASHGDMQVVSGGLDMRAVVWNTTNANYQVQTIFTKHTTAIEATTFDAAGQIIATASQGGLIRVWRATDGQEIHGYYQPAQVPMRAIAFSPVQQNLVLGGDDGLIRLWTNGLVCSQQVQSNFGTQCTQVPQILKAHSKPVRAIAWSPSGRFLATGGEDGRLVVWSTQQSQAPLFITQVAGTIRSLAWGMTDALLASASGNTVTIWALH
jgi:WD40 repeat protein